MAFIRRLITVIFLFFAFQAALSAYVEEEMKLVQDEITSLERVRFKLELEMQEAMKTKGQYIFQINASLW